MKAQVKVFAEFEINKPLSLVFFKDVEFDNQEYIAHLCHKVMTDLQKIYEEKVFMKAEITVEPFNYDNGVEPISK